MNETKDRYKAEESHNTFSIQPYHYYRKGIKWYLLGIISIAIVLAFYFNRLPQYGLVLLIGIAIMLMIWLSKELLLKIPLRYTFDANQNKIFQSNVIMKNRKLFDLNKTVIFVSEDNEGWAFAIGEKKKHLVTNYKISEYFGNSKKSMKKADLYEQEILSQIHVLIEKVSNKV